MTDWELLEDYVGRRSEAAFARLVERHWRMVLAACRRETCDLCLAEDAAQVTFLVLARRAGMLRRKGNLAAWLFVTARLTARNACRHEKRRMDLEREAAEMTDGNSNDDGGTWPHLVPFLNDAIASLRPADRNIVLLRYFEDLNTSETAVELGISEAAVRTRLSRAIERLRLYFTRHGLFLTGIALAVLLQEERADAAIPVGLAAHLAKMAVGGPANPSLLPNASRLSQLMKGVQKQMLLAKLKVTAAVVGAAAIGAGAAVKAMETAPHAIRTPQVIGNGATAPLKAAPGPIAVSGVRSYDVADLLTTEPTTVNTPFPAVIKGLSGQGQVFGSRRLVYPKLGGRPTRYGTRGFIASPSGTKYLDDVAFEDCDDAGRAVGELFSRNLPCVYENGDVTPLPLPAGCVSGMADRIAGKFIAGRVVTVNLNERICLWTQGHIEDVTPFLPAAFRTSASALHTSPFVFGLDSRGDILVEEDVSRFHNDFCLLTADHRAIELSANWAYLNRRGDLLIQRGAEISLASPATGAEHPVLPLKDLDYGDVSSFNSRGDILFSGNDHGTTTYYTVNGGVVTRLSLPDAIQHTRYAPLLGNNGQIAVLAIASDGRDHVLLMTPTRS